MDVRQPGPPEPQMSPAARMTARVQHAFTAQKQEGDTLSQYISNLTPNPLTWEEIKAEVKTISTESKSWGKSRKYMMAFFVVTCLAACIAYGIIAKQTNSFTKGLPTTLPFLSVSAMAILYLAKNQRSKRTRDQLGDLASRRPKLKTDDENVKKMIGGDKKIKVPAGVDHHYQFFIKAFSYNYNISKEKLKELSADEKFFEFYQTISEGLFNNPKKLSEASLLESVLVEKYKLTPRTSLESSFIKCLSFGDPVPVPVHDNKQSKTEDIKIGIYEAGKVTQYKAKEIIQKRENQITNTRVRRFLYVVILAVVVATYIFFRPAVKIVGIEAGISIAILSIFSKNKFRKMFKQIQQNKTYQQAVSQFAAHYSIDPKKVGQDFQFFKYFVLLYKYEVANIDERKALDDSIIKSEKALKTKYGAKEPEALKPDKILNHQITPLKLTFAAAAAA